MFQRDGDIVRARIIDWQGVSRGPAILDVAGIIAESLTAEDRRCHEDVLLRRYHGQLLDHGIRGYSFEALKRDYSRALMVRPVGQIGWLARVLDYPPIGRELDLVEALINPGRVFQAMLDHWDAGRMNG